VGAKNLMLQMDLYHMQIMEGDWHAAQANMLRHAAMYRSLACPSVTSHSTGEVHYPFLYKLRRNWLQRMIGCEYRPPQYEAGFLVQRAKDQKSPTSKENRLGAKIALLVLELWVVQCAENLLRADTKV